MVPRGANVESRFEPTGLAVYARAATAKMAEATETNNEARFRAFESVNSHKFIEALISHNVLRELCVVLRPLLRKTNENRFTESQLLILHYATSQEPENGERSQQDWKIHERAY